MCSLRGSDSQPIAWIVFPTHIHTCVLATCACRQYLVSLALNSVLVAQILAFGGGSKRQSAAGKRASKATKKQQ